MISWISLIAGTCMSARPGFVLVWISLRYLFASQIVVSPWLRHLILLSVQCSSTGLRCLHAQRCSSATYPDPLLLSVFLWSTLRNSGRPPLLKKRKRLPSKLSLHSKNVALFTSQTMESHLVSESDLFLTPATSHNTIHG